MDDTTPSTFLAAYEGICQLGAVEFRSSDESPHAELARIAQSLRRSFESRTGVFGPEDPWFEARSRAFWDDALTTQGFAERALPHLGKEAWAWGRYVSALGRAHRGLFSAEDVTNKGARLVDLWSGAELLVQHVDEAQAIALEHAEGYFDARVIAASEAGPLFVLPGAFHHAPDASEALARVVDAARARGMKTNAALDALLRMELVFRSSSRVKVTFAYRVESLPR
ncbi:hypothetical protein AKJ09_05182 [Labilithrix luteola]|uniref:Uncharacterized protein n=1 Tax=Labilithrix luteola TaxID=1391654 RepID=A0A0K1PYB4_9BACT|nr:hypothetical protein [Labilithrix luteola]AKU98518.1 hypothetical protein AKJ09_05182 [Labilithrix luteola]